MSVEVLLEKVTKTIGEGPHWDDRTQCLIFVDLLSGDLYRWNSVSGKLESRHLETSVGFVVPSRKGGYIVGLGRKLVHYDWDTEVVTTLHEVDLDKPNNRFNDGKCDAKGRIWAGTMANETAPGVLEPEQGSLYSLDVDGSLKKHVEKINISNGLAWTADNKTMYYIDTLPRKVYAFDFDVDARIISNKRVIVDYPEGTNETMGLPDGMAIDEDGMIWVACYRGGKVIRFNPNTGEQIRNIDIPARRITSCCFGGRNFDELFVTCGTTGASDKELETYPMTGSVFRVTGLGVKGLPAPIYEG